MTDVSPSRRRLGRWLLAGGALALPLTASFSYAAAAQDRPIEDVEVAPSEAPPAPPVPPVPPAAPEAPEAPAAPAAPHVERHVFKLHRDGNEADAGKREQHVFVMRTDGPLTPEEKKKFEAMRREWEKKGAEWRAKSAEWRKMAEEQRTFALAHVPEVSTNCDQAGESGTRSWTDDGGRQHVVICQRIVRQNAQMAQGHALMSLRGARNMIAGNSDMSDSVKREVLSDLDNEIARLEAER